MNVNFTGYGENVATFVCDDTVKEGCLVELSDDYTVKVCTVGNEFIGVCVGVRDGYAAVQLSGYIECTKTSEIDLGLVGLVAETTTTVKSSDTAKRMCNVIRTQDKIGFIL